MQSCVQTGVIYYFNQLTTSMKQSLYALKAAILFCPFKVQQMKSTISAVDSPSVFPFCLHEFLHSKRSFLLTWMFLKMKVSASAVHTYMCILAVSAHMLKLSQGSSYS